MKEIFQGDSPTKKPLNYINYSHAEYNLLNGQEEQKRQSPLLDPTRQDMHQLQQECRDN